MAGYIRVPVETNPETLANAIVAYIQSQEPSYVPSDGNLDTWIIKAVAAKAAENRTLASDVPDSIFTSLGATIFSIPPIDSVAATGSTTWTLIDTLGHTIPANTFVGLRDTNGDLQTFYTSADVIVAPGDSTTATGEVTIVAVELGTVCNALSGTVEQITVIDWVSSITLVSPTGGGVDPETEDDYLNRLARKLTSLSTVPILPQDFANAALDADPGVYRAVAIDLYNPIHNLLTANEADAETDASGWVNDANAAVSSTSATFAHGAKAVRLTSVGSGNMSAVLNREVPVTPGEKITVIGSVRSAVSVRSCEIGIRWIDASHSIITTIFQGAANSLTSAYGQRAATAVAPSNAAYYKVVLMVLGTGGASEVHDWDMMSARHGAGTDWVAGGTAETGNIRTVTVAAVDIDGNPVSSGIKTNIVNYIQARREQNFIAHVMDPNYTEMDAAATVTTLPGFDPTSVSTAVIAAITNYFSPTNWGIDPTVIGTAAASTWVDQGTVYYNELIALISNVAGVGRVTVLTLNIHGNTPASVDVPIDSPAGLTTVGTITCTTV